MSPDMSVAVDTRMISYANNILSTVVLAAPILSVQLAEKPCDVLARFLPIFGKFLAAFLRAVSNACEIVRERRQQAFVLAHGAVTYACGDLIAQTAFAPATSAAPDGQSLWVPTQTACAALIGLLSDALPFYHWSSFLASVDEGPRRAALERRVPIVARRPALLLPLKIAAHLATFQHFSTGLYLLLQGLTRGDGSLSEAITFVRAKYMAAIIPALGSFTLGGPIIYSLPVVAGAALRNFGVLAMCVYLAWVSAR